VPAPPRPDITCPGDPGATIRRRVRPPCIVTDPATLDPVGIPAADEDGPFRPQPHAHLAASGAAGRL